MAVSCFLFNFARKLNRRDFNSEILHSRHKKNNFFFYNFFLQFNYIVLRAKKAIFCFCFCFCLYTKDDDLSAWYFYCCLSPEPRRHKNLCRSHLLNLSLPVPLFFPQDPSSLCSCQPSLPLFGDSGCLWNTYQRNWSVGALSPALRCCLRPGPEVGRHIGRHILFHDSRCCAAPSSVGDVLHPSSFYWPSSKAQFPLQALEKRHCAPDTRQVNFQAPSLPVCINPADKIAPNRKYKNTTRSTGFRLTIKIVAKFWFTSLTTGQTH